MSEFISAELYWTVYLIQLIAIGTIFFVQLMRNKKNVMWCQTLFLLLFVSVGASTLWMIFSQCELWVNCGVTLVFMVLGIMFEPKRSANHSGF